MKPIIYEDEKQAIQIERESTGIAKKNVGEKKEEGNEDDETLRPVHKVSVI